MILKFEINTCDPQSLAHAKSVIDALSNTQPPEKLQEKKPTPIKAPPPPPETMEQPTPIKAPPPPPETMEQPTPPETMEQPTPIQDNKAIKEIKDNQDLILRECNKFRSLGVSVEQIKEKTSHFFGVSNPTKVKTRNKQNIESFLKSLENLAPSQAPSQAPSKQPAVDLKKKIQSLCRAIATKYGTTASIEQKKAQSKLVADAIKTYGLQDKLTDVNPTHYPALLEQLQKISSEQGV